MEWVALALPVWIEVFDLPPTLADPTARSNPSRHHRQTTQHQSLSTIHTGDCQLSKTMAWQLFAQEVQWVIPVDEMGGTGFASVYRSV